MTLQMITIDGSEGEGGGQILRSSVGLAVVTGRTVRIERIRAGRSRPGLMRQHLTAIEAAATICHGRLTGASLGSTALTFEPQQMCPGSYHFRIGTAGSTTLVLQTILPALLTASGPSEVILEGGTHNAWAPPFEFFQRVYLPLVQRMGPRVTARLERYGFHPAGGGRIVVTIQPASGLCGFDLTERGALLSRSATILISHLPLKIAEREAQRLSRRLHWPRTDVEIEPVESAGPGNVILAEVRSENVSELVTGFGRIGVPAERVVDEVISEITRYLNSAAPVGEHLADQLLLPLALSAAQSDTGQVGRFGGSFRAVALTGHTVTHINLLHRMLPVEIAAQQDRDGFLITVAPSGAAGIDEHGPPASTETAGRKIG